MSFQRVVGISMFVSFFLCFVFHDDIKSWINPTTIKMVTAEGKGDAAKEMAYECVDLGWFPSVSNTGPIGDTGLTIYTFVLDIGPATLGYLNPGQHEAVAQCTAREGFYTSHLQVAQKVDGPEFGSTMIHVEAILSHVGTSRSVVLYLVKSGPTSGLNAYRKHLVDEQNEKYCR